MGHDIVSPRIDGLQIIPLRKIPDDRGMVMHMLRRDAIHFNGFGEVYFSSVKPGVVKAWKRHQRMIQHLAVPVGKIQLVLFDSRDNSQTRKVVQQIVTGIDQFFLIRIPAMVWYGFKGIFPTDSLIANVSDIPHEPSEVDRLDSSSTEIPFQW